MKKTFTLKSTKCKCLKGIIHVPPDKSISIRALLVSSICFGNSKIKNLLISDDVINTLESLKKLGIKVKKKNNFIEVYGNGGYFKNPKSSLDLGNSGTGVRLLCGLLCNRGVKARLVGDKSLSSRSMMRIVDPLSKMNAVLKHKNGFLPLEIQNNHDTSIPIKYNLKFGSAQIKSAILLAGLNLKGTTTVKENIPSRDHTEIMLKHFGANISKKKNIIKLQSPNLLKGNDVVIPGDFSSAAFIIVATLITKNSNSTIKDVGLNFFRTGLIDVLKKMQANITLKNKRYQNGELVGDIVVKSSNLFSITVNKTISPRLIDEYPILFVAASFAQGKSKFYGLDELKLKESDRLKSMSQALKDAGVEILEKNNSLEILGKKQNKGGNQVQTNLDHRIAMSMLVFGMASKEPVKIDDMKMIKTSFPNFKKIFNNLGAKIELVQK